ncbi:hypothetical protein ABNX05_11225 [Lysinibacillus sp. M3]|uniref:Uncharacterized protein n=1 Tax=Lysinibacillus zambalensis TaxID=3160866 RepID=A0ABV1MRQ5_9BACI
MRKKYKSKVAKKIKTYCQVNYDKVSKSKMRMGNGLFNHRCQLNTVQMVKEGLMKSVYLCICTNDEDYPIVHFINLSNDNKFIDNTLGFDYESYDYYIIRKIDESEFNKMNDLLMDTKKMLIMQHSRTLMNKIFRVDEYNLGI